MSIPATVYRSNYKEDDAWTRFLLKTSQRCWRRFGRLLDLVGVLEADANEPIKHHWEWQDGEDRQQERTAQEKGKDLLLAEEERACRDEESKAHAPEEVSSGSMSGKAYPESGVVEKILRIRNMGR
ncbi:MAG: hypothetical protein WBE76_24590 [Terracidiphilus sp.]